MKNLLHAAILYLSLAAGTAFAADKIDIDIDTSIDPVEAVGLVISSDGTDQRLESTWIKRPGVVTVSVPITKSDRAEGTVVTALVKGEDGSIAFGNTKAAWIPAISSSFYALPECPIRKAPKGLASDAGLVQSLVDVRSKRRSVLQEKISTMLTGDFYKTLLKLEHGFGMDQGRPLDSSLPPLELEDRLNRLETAIINYRAQKKPADTSSQDGEAAGETE